jgi:hypothetical protein
MTKKEGGIGQMNKKMFSGIIIGLVIVSGLFIGYSVAATSKSKDQKPTLEKLQLQQERIEAVNAIQNLMGRFVFYRLANMKYRCTELFANGDPDLKIQGPSIMVGPDAAIRAYGDPKTPSAPIAGEMHFHTLVSPIIEVAGDGKTARAQWMSPGAVSQVRGGAASANWVWSKEVADFKKMDNGEWKMWHQRIIGIFMTSYDKPWTEPNAMSGGQPGAGAPGAGAHGAGQAGGDRPNTDKSGYSTTGVLELVLEPPTPYETWDDSMSCVK